MRPSASTAAASVKINPAPPMAIFPRWTKCQSLAKPSCDEYWHIGEMTTRFFRVTPRRVIGENRSGFDAIEILLTGLLRNDQNGEMRNGESRDCAQSCPGPRWHKAYSLSASSAWPRVHVIL